jgi:hypothetical protein
VRARVRSYEGEHGKLPVQVYPDDTYPPYDVIVDLKLSSRTTVDMAIDLAHAIGATPDWLVSPGDSDFPELAESPRVA